MEAGSLAIWYHWSPAKKGQETRASAEVHVNLWRRRIEKISNKEETFLDIGLRLRDASSIADFRLYLPFHVTQNDIRDLGKVLHNRVTLMAVFNEAYIAGEFDVLGTFSIHDTSNVEVLCCHSLNPGVDFTVATRNDLHSGTIVHFTDGLCTRFRSDADQYIRFRIILDKETDKAFSQLHRQFDAVFLSAIPRDEVVEFRFNERRSLPQEIIDEMSARDHNELFKFTALHYFLIRESDSQFVMSHTDFHKVRLL
jgi:hypothetical protein